MASYIDFDTHVYEPLSVWNDYLDPKFRDRAPKWREYDGGRLGVEVGGRNFPSMAHHPGMAKIYGKDSKVDRSGNDPVERLKFMDRLNVDIQVIFPTLGMHGFSGSVADPQLAEAFARAYNRYMGEFVSTDRRRLRGAMIVPANHPEIAAAEIRRAHREHGLNVIYLNPAPPGDIAWSHRSRDVMWRTAEELGLTVVFHESTTGCPPNAAGIHRYAGNWPMVYYCTHIVEASLALTDLILGGTLQRFPKLKIGAAESHVHWIPGWLAFMDQQFGAGTKIWNDESGEAALELKPSQYFNRQCFVAAFTEDTMISECLTVARDAIVVISDWPHPINSVHAKEGLQAVAERADLNATEKSLVLVENPRRFL